MTPVGECGRKEMTAEERVIGGLGVMLGATWAWMIPDSYGPLVFGGAYVLFAIWKDYRAQPNRKD